MSHSFYLLQRDRDDLRKACKRLPLQTKRHLRPDFQAHFPEYANTPGYANTILLRPVKGPRLR
jgi:hypothetical protein